jgi:hypothetical protein
MSITTTEAKIKKVQDETGVNIGLESGFRRNDEKWYFSTFYEFINVKFFIVVSKKLLMKLHAANIGGLSIKAG